MILKKGKKYAKYKGPIYKGKNLVKEDNNSSSLDTPSKGNSVFIQIYYIGKGKNFKAFYRGTIRNYKMHGIGELLKFDGTKYAGGFKDGLYEGYGEFVEKMVFCTPRACFMAKAISWQKTEPILSVNSGMDPSMVEKI